MHLLQIVRSYLGIPVHALVMNDCMLAPFSSFDRHLGTPYMKCGAGGNAGLGRRGEEAAFAYEVEKLKGSYPALAELVLPHYKLRNCPGSADGKLVSPNALTNRFDRFMKKHNLKPIRFHDLRHSCASILYANGVDILTIQKILGHAQLSTTYMYTHIINDQQHLALSQMSGQIMGTLDVRKGE